jgi:predicted nucleic acid-binding protein
MNTAGSALVATNVVVPYFRGQIKAELAHLGKPIPDNDVWIAALARQHDLPLATRDDHFTAVPALKTLAW